MSRPPKPALAPAGAASRRGPAEQAPRRCLACGREMTSAQPVLRLGRVTVHVQCAAYRRRRLAE